MAILFKCRWIKTYKLIALISATIFFTQLYLAYNFFPVDNGSRTAPSEFYKPNGNHNQNNNIFNDIGEVSARKTMGDDEDNIAPERQMKKSVKKANPLDKNKTSLRLEELDFVPSCPITAKEAISAIHRAKTQQCKQIIANITCMIRSGQFYKDYLTSSCPNDGLLPGKSLGCFKDEKKFRLLSGYYANYEKTNMPQQCIDICLQGGFAYAGLQYSTECFCGENRPPSVSKLADSSCNMKCSGDPKKVCGGYFTMNIFQTGVTKFNPQIPELSTTASEEPVGIVFLLTLNGRALRQVRRLINILYHERHYFYIHVDVRQDYLFRELLPLETQFSNIRLSRKRFATIWGGASLLEMLLSSMTDIQRYDWNWDFIINLSESDFPVKSLMKLEEFLTANKDQNFVKSHGREVQRFIQKQGLDKTFVQCDAHMWRIGDRKMPRGLIVDGGSDWVALSRSFVAYVTGPTDELLEGLLVIFKHTLLPAESFFHTVLRNSHFCDKYVDNNLHVTNWKRKLGCKCQYKHVVDWCGCSPNDFKPEDWPRLQATEDRQLFFARKFEPVVSQAIILRVEQWIGAVDYTNVKNIDAYWQSIYHNKDLSPPVDDALITVATSLLSHNTETLSLEDCSITPLKIIEILSYHYDDMHKGNVISYEAKIRNIGSIRVETWYKYHSHFDILKQTKLSNRLKIFTINSDYDQKEQIFRNFGCSLGPFSEPALMYHFIPCVAELSSSHNVTIVWIDSAGDIANVDDIHIDEGDNLNYVKPVVKSPLLPGVWSVKLLERGVLIAQTQFLITPLLYFTGEKISYADLSMIHGGSMNRYKDYKLRYYEIAPSLMPKAEKRAAQIRSDANIKRMGADLTEWINVLSGQFYKVLRTCIVRNEGKSFKCGDINLEICNNTSWSSFAPDPKSLINDSFVQIRKSNEKIAV